MDRSTPPPVYTIGNLTLPRPVTAILSNGIVLHTFKGGTQDVNQLSISWTGGSMESRIPALAKLTGIMLREGTDAMSGTQISEALDFNGAMLKISNDAHITALNISSLNSKTSRIMPIIRDIVASPSFPEQTFRLLRDIEVKEFMLSQTKVLTLCNQLLGKMIRGAEHPMARVPEVSEMESLTVDDLRSFYKDLYSAKGCHAFLSGNITDDVYKCVTSMLETLPMGGDGLKQIIVPNHAEAPGYEVIEKNDAVQAAVGIAIPAPARSHPDYVPLRFTVTALGGFFGSRLMKNIREDKGYTYGIVAYLLGSKEGSYIMISAQCDRRYVDALIDEVKAELRRMVTEPLSDDELFRLKQYMSSSLMETLDSPFSIMDYYRSIECVGIPDGYFESQVDWAHHITSADIVEMATRYLNPDEMRIAVCR